MQEKPYDYEYFLERLLLKNEESEVNYFFFVLLLF